MRHLPLPPNASDGAFAALVDAARRMEPSPEAVASLAQHLANSGMRLTWPASLRTGDVASTGGPGSLSTLVAPLMLRELGATVVKLAVPGRPAGAIDVLATLPGYRIRLGAARVRALINGYGMAHFLADKQFAPLDASLFAYRQRTDSVAVPILAAASLLSKKIAVGVQSLGLDVRVGTDGNFGTTRAEARASARLFCQAARYLGVRAVAFLSDDCGPAQPWIGRGESLRAIAIATGARSDGESGNTESDWLMGHINDCATMAGLTYGRFENGSPPPPSLSSLASDGGVVRQSALRDALARHLDSQGASWEMLLARADAVAASSQRAILALKDGVARVDLSGVRDALTDAQRDCETYDGRGDAFLDPAGVELLVRPGRIVEAGSVLAYLRTDSTMPELALCRLRERLERAICTEKPSDLTQAKASPEPLELVYA